VFIFHESITHVNGGVSLVEIVCNGEYIYIDSPSVHYLFNSE